uniref:Basic tail secreted protein n=1 Tax=Rhipicephalus appendiculatus TaxID=34631 RepID=A0A131YPU2_RHIAP
MTTTWTLLSLLFAIHALPNVHAYTSSHSFCYRLVPHHITAVTTPCRYPCLLPSSNVQPTVHVNYELNGTPCITPGSHYTGRREVSHCMDGVCVQRKSSRALKRSKRACLLGIAAWKLIKKIKEAKRRRKQMELAREAASYGGSSSEDETASDGGANVGAGGAYGGGRGSWPGSIGVGTGSGGAIQGGLGGGNVGRGGMIPGSLGGTNVGAGAMFPGRFGGIHGRPSGAPSYWSQNPGEGGLDSGGPTRSWRTNGGGGGMGSSGGPDLASENFGPSSSGRFGPAHSSSGGDGFGSFGGDSGDYRQTKLN